MRGGKAACRIVYARGKYWDEVRSSATTRRAALELQRMLAKITGVEIPIDEGGNPAVSKLPAIILGKGVFRGDIYDVKPEFLRALRELGVSDGYALGEWKGNLHVFGSREKGTLNGVYALVENNSDYIYVRPDPRIGEVFTPQTNGTFNLVWGRDVLVKHVFDVRGFWNLHDPEYWNANGCTTTFGDWKDVRPFTRGAHNINWYAGFTEGFKKHPEWFGMVDGRRDKNYGNMLCFTNPELLGYFTNRVNDTMRLTQWNELSGLSMSLDDSLKWCECPKCRAPMTLGDGKVIAATDPRFMSTQYFRFLNAGAESLASEFPGRMISTYGYFQSAYVPACPVAGNICVAFASYPRMYEDEPIFVDEAAVWLKRFRAWGKKIPRRNLTVYSYDGLGMGFPRPIAHARRRELAEYAAYACGVVAESSTQDPDRIDPLTGKPTSTCRTFDISAIEYWVLARLYRDPDQDVERLYKRFCYRAFKEAARPMERFYGTIRTVFIRDGRGKGWDVKKNVRSCFVDSGREDELRGYLAEAQRVVRHPVSRRLVERAAARFEQLLGEGRR